MTEGIIEPNKLHHLSYSGMGSYLQCPSQWAEVYIKGAPRTDTVFTMFGRIIHELMEYLSLHPGDRNLPKAIELYNAHWQEFHLTDMYFYNRGLDMLEKYLARDNAFAYEILGTELQFGMNEKGEGTPMFIGNVPVLGFIDRIEKVDEETIIVRDYKTNIMPFSNEEVQNHMQMSMYDIIARKLFPWANTVILILDQPAFGEFQSTRTDEQRKSTEEFIINTWQQMLYDKRFGDKPNQYCCYCTKRDGCETYKKALTMKIAIADSNDTVGLWQEREQLVYQEKAIKGRITEIDVAIKGMMAANGQSTLAVQNSEFYFTQQRRKEYPVPKVKDIAHSMGLDDVIQDCMKFEKTKFEKHPKVKGNKILMTMIDQCAIVSYTKPSLACRELNDARLDEE